MDPRKPAQVMSFPASRVPIVDYLQVASHKHLVHGLIEVDVTRLRRFIHEHRAQTGEGLSLTAFIAASVGRAAARHRQVHAYRDWRGRLALFEDVDIGMPIEHDVDGQRVGTPYVIRAANRKTPFEIHGEIRAAQAAPPPTHRHIHLYARLPGVLRRGFWRLMLRQPSMMRRIAGTVGITAVGMFGAGGGWGIPITGYTLLVTVGGISERLALVDERPETREYLCLTITIDHDVVDGAPAARFVHTLRELIENDHALEEGIVPRNARMV